MAGTETLREFVASLGWEQNEREQRKFVDAIETATEKAIIWADAIKEGAEKIADAIADTVKEFATLGLSADRLKTSPTKIKALEEAFTLLGQSAGSADAVINSLDQAFRDPGRAAVLRQYGIDAEDKVEATKQLASALAKLPEVQQNWLAGLAGINTAQVETLVRQQEFNRLYDEAIESMHNSGITDEEVRRSTEFWKTYTKAQTNVSHILEGAELQITGSVLLKPLTDLKESLESNQGTIASGMAGIFLGALDLVEEAGKGMLDFYTLASGDTLTDTATEWKAFTHGHHGRAAHRRRAGTRRKGVL